MYHCYPSLVDCTRVKYRPRMASLIVVSRSHHEWYFNVTVLGTGKKSCSENTPCFLQSPSTTYFVLFARRRGPQRNGVYRVCAVRQCTVNERQVCRRCSFHLASNLQVGWSTIQLSSNLLFLLYLSLFLQASKCRLSTQFAMPCSTHLSRKPSRCPFDSISQQTPFRTPPRCHQPLIRRCLPPVLLRDERRIYLCC